MKDDPKKVLDEIDKLLKSDLDNNETVLRISQEIMKYKKIRDEILKDLTPETVKRKTPIFSHKD
jgi:hypothetical protein